MTIRITKTLLIFAIAFYYTLVVINNTTDYNSNLQFVRHVLMMDSTFPDNHVMWRAINSPAIHTLFYISLIAWESITMILCWVGGVTLMRNLRAPARAFRRAKNAAITGLALGLVLWLTAFLTIGGEWFLMWQSQKWNGQDAAFRMFTMVGIVLILVVMKDDELENAELS